MEFGETEGRPRGFVVIEEETFTNNQTSDKMEYNSTPHASLGIDDAHQAGSCSFKPALTIDRQIDHLISQGICVNDRTAAARTLGDANYYRLRGYWMTFEDNGAILPDTTFEHIRSVYEFDRELRLWLWRMIERVELKVRTQFAYVLSTSFGPDAYMKPGCFRDAEAHKQSLKSIQKEIDRGRRQGMPCILHNLNKYGELPLWAAVEVMSMGTVSALYGNLRPDLQVEGCEKPVVEEISSAFGIGPGFLKSWLRHLTMVRNICAHHGRFYNRLLKSKPRMLRRDRPWAGDREFPTFITLKRIYEVSWPEVWEVELDALDKLIETYSRVDLAPMGFPAGWHDILLLQGEQSKEAVSGSDAPEDS